MFYYCYRNDLSNMSFFSHSIGHHSGRGFRACTPPMYDRCAFRTSLHNGLCTNSSSINTRTRHSLSARIHGTFLRFLGAQTVLVPCNTFIQRPRRHAMVHSTSDHVPSTASACCRSARKGRGSLVERSNTDARGDVRSAHATQTTGLVSPITSTHVTRTTPNPLRRSSLRRGKISWSRPHQENPRRRQLLQVSALAYSDSPCLDSQHDKIRIIRNNLFDATQQGG
ncbi:hypothetical protein BDU57DRAFT_182857 [Ampelomyces quisqualis]|uniref:Uncharacterized protein n=1 Tax=Ampelomyces quisqualis TaxID=50730 RepID=A0A6A5QVS5_AMPQU|nr:hypothetical protein BDU57DRAFT_182857 [Ampelomyces quisqualis]